MRNCVLAQIYNNRPNQDLTWAIIYGNLATSFTCNWKPAFRTWIKVISKPFLVPSLYTVLTAIYLDKRWRSQNKKNICSHSLDVSESFFILRSSTLFNLARSSSSGHLELSAFQFPKLVRQNCQRNNQFSGRIFLFLVSYRLLQRSPSWPFRRLRLHKFLLVHVSGGLCSCENFCINRVFDWRVSFPSRQRVNVHFCRFWVQAEPTLFLRKLFSGSSIRLNRLSPPWRVLIEITIKATTDGSAEKWWFQLGILGRETRCDTFNLQGTCACDNEIKLVLDSTIKNQSTKVALGFDSCLSLLIVGWWVVKNSFLFVLLPPEASNYSMLVN